MKNKGKNRTRGFVSPGRLSREMRHLGKRVHRVIITEPPRKDWNKDFKAQGLWASTKHWGSSYKYELMFENSEDLTFFMLTGYQG